MDLVNAQCAKPRTNEPSTIREYSTAMNETIDGILHNLNAIESFISPAMDDGEDLAPSNFTEDMHLKCEKLKKIADKTARLREVLGV